MEGIKERVNEIDQFDLIGQEKEKEGKVKKYINKSMSDLCVHKSFAWL